LRGLNCHVVYVLPLDLAYGRIAGTLQNRYGDIPLIPMVETRTRPPQSADHPAGLEIMRAVIRKRMAFADIHHEGQAFTEGTMDTLIRASGGEPRQLMHLVRQAAIYGGLPITDQGTRLALLSARKTLRRPLEGNAISPSRLYFDATRLGIQNIYDAAFVTHYIHKAAPEFSLSTAWKTLVNSLSYRMLSFKKGAPFPTPDEWRRSASA
jgi:hypothetical protein